MFGAARVDAILFDLDGTLIDSDDQLVDSVAGLLFRLRLRHPRTAARRLVMAFETPVNALVSLADALRLDSVMAGVAGAIRRSTGLRSQPTFRIISGVREMLAYLSADYQLGVVTTRGHDDAMAFLEQYSLHDFFSAIITRESTDRLKPHPSPVREAARLLGIPPDRCVMVGDTPVDVRSARKAGAWAIGVLCGFGERQELEQAGAHAVIDHTPELSSLLRAEPESG
jgi:phosphoglycolate phosphatase-like HAD superfamily hydrolase